MVDKIIHKKLEIDQQDPPSNRDWTQVILRNRKQLLLYIVSLLMHCRIVQNSREEINVYVDSII